MRIDMALLQLQMPFMLSLHEHLVRLAPHWQLWLSPPLQWLLLLQAQALRASCNVLLLLLHCNILLQAGSLHGCCWAWRRTLAAPGSTMKQYNKPLL
jgi:hypothetical protein